MGAIILNGTSSSGKTSIVRAIQKISPIPFLHASVDAFTDMFDLDIIKDDELWWECHNTGVSLFHRALPTILSSRFPVIIDHVFVERDWYQECYNHLKDRPILSVGVHCPLEILKAREQARGDRAIGLAERQFPRVHSHGAYDMEVDTSVASPEVNAELILTVFNGRE